MPIDFSKIRALTASEIIRALLADGFVLRKSAQDAAASSLGSETLPPRSVVRELLKEPAWKPSPL